MNKNMLFRFKPGYMLVSGEFYKRLVEIDTREYRAARALLKTKVPDYGAPHPRWGDIWDLEGVQFGPFDHKYEPAILDEGYEARDPADEVRIAYGWGNSMLYKPFTLREWETALCTTS